MESPEEKVERIDGENKVVRNESFEKLEEARENNDKEGEKAVEEQKNCIESEKTKEIKEEEQKIQGGKYAKENALFEKVETNEPPRSFHKNEKKEELFEEIKVENPAKSAIDAKIEEIHQLVLDCLYDQALLLTKQIKQEKDFDFTCLSQHQQNIIIDVEETCKHIDEVCLYLNDEDGWYVDSSNSYVTTKYKKYPNGDSYLMKMEGELNFPIENMCSIVYEIEYFNEFVPFCSKSYTIKQLNKGCKLCYFSLDIPFWSNREGYIRGFGVDRIDKDGTILIISKTIDEDKPLCQRAEFEIPPVQKAVRLKMDHFCFEITPITRNKFKLRSLLNIEPKVAYVPQFVINFFARKIGAHMFSKLIHLAENMNEKKWLEIHKKLDSKDYYTWINRRIEEVEKKKKQAEEEKNTESDKNPVKI